MTSMFCCECWLAFTDYAGQVPGGSLPFFTELRYHDQGFVYNIMA